MTYDAGITSPRIILHADMDCFYAAVEMRDHPQYAAKPVIVGADPQGGTGGGLSPPARTRPGRSASDLPCPYRRHTDSARTPFSSVRI